MEHAIFVAINGFAFGASFLLSRVLLPEADRVERLFSTVAGFPIVVVPGATVLALFGALRPVPALLLVMGVAALIAVVLAGRASRGQPRSASETTPAGTRSAAERVVLSLAVGVLAALALRWLDHLAIEPSRYQWDDYSYHGPMVAHWVQAGSFVLAPPNYHGYFPGNAELLAAWFVLPTHMLAFAALCGIYSMALLGFSGAQAALRLGASEVGALLAAALLYAAAPFDHQAGSLAAVDLGGTALSGAAAAFALGGSSARSSRAWYGRVFYVGALCGLSIGTKVSYAPLAALLASFLAVEARPTRAQLLRGGLLFCACCLAGGGYFYLRNWALSGNPVFPAQLLFFDGPLDAAARERTSLWYQWQELDRTGRAATLGRLLDWPAAVAYLLLGGYALSAVAALRPAALRDPAARGRPLLLVCGLCLLLVITAGPFSGTANGQFAKLQIRLRFFLPVAFFAAPLVAHWAGRARLGGQALLCGILVWACEVDWSTLAFACAAAAALFFAGRWAPRMPRRVALVGRYASIAVLWLVADRAMVVKQEPTEAALRKVMRAWNVVERVPDGERISWFTTFDQYKYLQAFGPRLQRVAVPVNADGTRADFLHEDWRRYRPSWWQGRARPRDMQNLIRNLDRQDVHYVFVMKRHKGDWPRQRELLVGSERVRAIEQDKSYALFEILPANDRERAGAKGHEG